MKKGSAAVMSLAIAFLVSVVFAGNTYADCNQRVELRRFFSDLRKKDFPIIYPTIKDVDGSECGGDSSGPLADFVLEYDLSWWSGSANPDKVRIWSNDNEVLKALHSVPEWGNALDMGNKNLCDNKLRLCVGARAYQSAAILFNLLGHAYDPTDKDDFLDLYLWHEVDSAQQEPQGIITDNADGNLNDYDYPDTVHYSVWQINYNESEVGTNTTGDSGETDGPDMNVKLTELAKNNSDNFHHTLVIRPGRLFQIKTHFTNKGDEDGEFDGVYYASVDKDFDKDEDYKFGVDHDLELDAGDLLSEGKRDLVMNNEGKWYVWSRAKCEDDTDTSNDYSRNDDVEEYAVLKVVKPNLYFKEVIFGDGEFKFIPSETANVTALVHNEGAEPEQDAKLKFYLSEGEEYSNPTLLGERTMPGIHIEHRETRNESLSFVMPTTSGVYTLSIHADANSQIDEASEDDNWHHITFEVRAYTYISTQSCEQLVWYGDPLWEYEVVDAKSTFTVGEDINVLARFDNVYVDHRSKIEVYVNGNFSWANADENTSFDEVESMWGHSYSTVSQGAEVTGTYTFKTYMDIGQGYELIDTINVTVVP